MTAPIAKERSTLCKPIAAEDLRRGDFVAVLDEIVEYPSFFWCGEDLPPHEPVRVQWKSFEPGLPLRIVDFCLPFVLAKLPCGRHRTLDIRRCQLVRLDKAFAKRACKSLGEKRKRVKRRKKKARK
jgi:hypothetical protein